VSFFTVLCFNVQALVFVKYSSI